MAAAKNTQPAGASAPAKQETVARCVHAGFYGRKVYEAGDQVVGEEAEKLLAVRFQMAMKWVNAFERVGGDPAAAEAPAATGEPAPAPEVKPEA